MNLKTNIQLYKVAASKVNGVEISMEGIQDYSYPIARPLFFYIKKAHVAWNINSFFNILRKASMK